MKNNKFIKYFFVDQDWETHSDTKIINKTDFKAFYLNENSELRISDSKNFAELKLYSKQDNSITTFIYETPFKEAIDLSKNFKFIEGEDGSEYEYTEYKIIYEGNFFTIIHYSDTDEHIGFIEFNSENEIFKLPFFLRDK